MEALTGDFQGSPADITQVALSGLDVYAHNVETVEALTPFVRDRRAKYRQSLEVLRLAKEVTGGRVVTKTSLMLGVGEQEDQLLQTLKGWCLLSGEKEFVINGVFFLDFRSSSERRGRGDVRSIHATFKETHEGRPIRRTGRV